MAAVAAELDVSPQKPQMPSSYRDCDYVSDEMQNFLQLDCPEDISPPGLDNIHYTNSTLFPEWLLSTSDWKKTKVNTNAGNAISEILQIPQTQRTVDQISTLVKWLMEVWETAKSMGYSKCVAMFKEFKYFRHEAGENIITEGERGLTFYIIISGETVVHKEQLGVVATLGKGKSFGEIALTGKDLRTATVRAITPVEVLRLHKVDYDHFVRDIQHAERREHYHLLRECHLFDSWNRARVDRIANTCKRKVFEKGVYVFHQGDEPDYVYILLEGSVDIIKEVQIVCKNRWPSGIKEWTGCAKSFKKSFVMNTINNRAAFFGELSILRDDTRSASCLATSRTTLVAIDRLEFLHMMEPGKQAEFQSSDTGVNDAAILQRVGHITGGPSSFAKSGDEQVMPNVVEKKKPPKKAKRVTIAPEPVVIPPPPVVVPTPLAISTSTIPRKTVMDSIGALVNLSPKNNLGPSGAAAAVEALIQKKKKTVSHLKHLGDYSSVGFSSHRFLHANMQNVAGSGAQAVRQLSGDSIQDQSQLLPPTAIPLYRSGSPPREDASTSMLVFSAISRNHGNAKAPKIAADDVQPLKALVTNMQEYTPTGRLASNSMMMNVDDIKDHIEAHKEWRSSPVTQGLRSNSASTRVGSNSQSLTSSQSQGRLAGEGSVISLAKFSHHSHSVESLPPKTAPAHLRHSTPTLFVNPQIQPIDISTQSIHRKPKLTYRDVMTGDWSCL